MKFFIIFLLLLITAFYFWNRHNHKWQELLTTQDVENYMAIAGKLQGAGINYKTTSGGEEYNFRQNTLNSKIPPVSYTIWVLKEDVYKAEKAMK
ncbi:MAG: hypothetical protein ACOYJ1_12355 [Peptococcales bacterium]|jgi:flagellar biosynthesis/type III secretory pathway M-ring protein FliF/YscJ